MNWIFPPIIQRALDEFCDTWNSHRIRLQRDLTLPSGHPPNQYYFAPENYGDQPARIAIPPEAVDSLRAELPLTREEAFRWVPNEFDALACKG